jgi:hypothetical protein
MENNPMNERRGIKPDRTPRSQFHLPGRLGGGHLLPLVPWLPGAPGLAEWDSAKDKREMRGSRRQNSVAGNDQGYQWFAGAKWQIDFCSGISRQELLLKNNSSLTEKWRKK